MHRLVALHFVAGALTVCAPATVRAQTQEMTLAASARAFFKQGLAFADGKDWAGAEDRFRRAMIIRRSPVIAFNLAVVLDQLGEVVEAAALLHQVEDDARGDVALEESARKLLPRVEAKFAGLTVELEGDPTGTTTRLDGVELVAAQIGAPVPVDPGAHELVVERDGRVVDRKQVDVAVATEASVSLRTVYVPTPEEVARAAALRDDQRAPPQRPRVTDAWWFWPGVGAVVVAMTVTGLILTSTVGGSSSAKPNDMMMAPTP